MRVQRLLPWAIALILIGLVGARFFWIDSYTIPQNGMFPAIPKGSSIWVNKFAFWKPSDVKRGDVVVYEHLENSQRYLYIWRVIGLPGERIQTNDTELLINNKIIPINHQRTDGDKQIYLEQHRDCQFEICFESTAKQLPPNSDIQLGPDEFFLMGDNRYSAADSRYKGPVRFSAICGKKI